MKPIYLRRALLAPAVMACLAFSQTALAAKDVTVAVPYGFDSLDPYNTNSTQSQAVGKGWYEGLFMFGLDFRINRLLATGDEVCEEGLTVTFYLRQGLEL